jgi:protease I
MNELTGLKIAILATNGFEQSELEKPKKALEQAGALVHIISPEFNKIKGWKGELHNWGDEFTVDVHLDKAKPDDYNALVLPGGVINPDTLRMNEKAIAFVKAFAQKPIAAICHGPWTLINAELVQGKTMTSWPSIKIDLINAGALWVDQEVVQDELLITSRNPSDIPAFIEAIIRLFSQLKN